MRHAVCETMDKNPSTYKNIARNQASTLKAATNCSKNMNLIFFQRHLASLHFY